jgi:preprotein translocase subunit SecE
LGVRFPPGLPDSNISESGFYFTGSLQMNARAETKDSRLDVLKWLVVVALVVVAVVGNQYFSAEPILYRVLGVLVLAGAAAALALQTTKGRVFAGLVKEARVEIRKVVWPTRQETSQTTLIVVVVVLVMALLLWGLDSLLGWLVSLIVG